MLFSSKNDESDGIKTFEVYFSYITQASNIFKQTKTLICVMVYIVELEDLKVLRRSPDLLNNVKISQGQLQLIMEQILFLPYTFWSSDLNNLMNNPSNSLVISEKKMFR